MATEIWITSVEHEKDSSGKPNGPIKRVCASVYDAAKNTLGAKTGYTRAQVIALLQAYDLATRNYTNALYTSVLINEGKNCRKGAKVEVTKDGKYITTEGNATTKDNLGSMPPCDC